MALVDLPEVTIGDLTVRSEIPLDAFEPAYVENLARQAVDRARVRWGSLIAARIATADLPLELFKDVIARSCMRVLRNPEGFTGETEGNYQYSKRVAVAGGFLMFSDDDITDLIGAAPSRLPGALHTGIYGR